MPPLRINVLNQITFIITAEEMVGSIRCSEGIELVIGLGERSGPAILAGYQVLAQQMGQPVSSLQIPRRRGKAIYTTSAIKAVHRQFRKLTKTKGGFTCENALLKLLYAGILKASEKWTHPVQNWNLTLSQLNIHFEGRIDEYVNL